MDKKEIPKAYDAKQYEGAIYAAWEKSGFFNPDNLPGDRSKIFSMILPPPNATGTLHMGHAVMLAVQDVIARFERMRGKKVLWLPGTDHAAIATNVKVESILQKTEGKTRHDLGREAFIKRVEDFVEQSRATIKNQVNKMGSSVDWSREAFTLDAPRNLAVRTMFKKMYDDGLIYRGYRVVNWDPQGQTVISDDELVYKESQGKLYTFKYSKDVPITIASTRPETKVGDTAIAVHPDDDRYKAYVGKTFSVEFAGVPLQLKVIADHHIDPNFGTGALGVTPAHSIIDFELSQTHSLPLIKVIDEAAHMTEAAGSSLEGLPVVEAREKVVAWLRDNQLLEKEEEIVQNLSTAERTGAVIEPIPMLQWFVSVNKPFAFHQSTRSPIQGLSDGQMVALKELMAHVVETGQVQIIPGSFEKVYFHWINNLRDWCISRQLWYGHRIPAWYRRSSVIPSEALAEPRDHEVYVGVEAPEGEDWEQDPDTLDTWFSSGMWTFSVLGWPNEQSVDLLQYHPTDMLETGRDIIFFWVARMILMSTYALGEVPFRATYLHGLVRDEQGRKMSKSLENIIDPLEMIAKYGADATRLSLMIGITPGNDTKLSEEKVANYRNFTNKLWNIARFVVGGAEMAERVEPTLADRWILSRFATVTNEVTNHLEKYEFSQAGEKLRDFTWNEFADWYLEVSKIQENKQPLRLILEQLLVLWHPFTPFVTEAIWKQWHEDLLIIQSWPIADLSQKDELAEKEFAFLQALIVAIRNIRAEHHIEPKTRVPVSVVASQKERILIESNREIIKTLARVETISFVESEIENAATALVGTMHVFVPLTGAIDESKEQVRIAAELLDLDRYLESVEQKLGNEEFTSKAPAHVIETMKQKRDNARARREALAKK